MKFASLDLLLKPVRMRLLKAKGLDYFIRSLIMGIELACMWMVCGRLFLVSGYRYGALISLVNNRWDWVHLVVITSTY